MHIEQLGARDRDMHYLPGDKARAEAWIKALVPSAEDEKIQSWLERPMSSRPRFAAHHFAPKYWHFKTAAEFTDAAEKKEEGWHLTHDAVPDTHKHHPPPHGMQATWDGDAWRVDGEEPHGMKRRLDNTCTDAEEPAKRPKPLERAFAHAEEQLKIVAEAGHEHEHACQNKHLSSEDAKLVLAEIALMRVAIEEFEDATAAREAAQKHAAAAAIAAKDVTMTTTTTAGAPAIESETPK